MLKIRHDLIDNDLVIVFIFNNNWIGNYYYKHRWVNASSFYPNNDIIKEYLEDNNFKVESYD